MSSLEDALEAEQEGPEAGNLELGGPTPGFEPVQQICYRVGIPVRVMLRFSESHTPGPDEVEDLLQQAEDLAALGVTGLVLGLPRQGQVAVGVIRRILSRAPNLKATFHRTFDETAHQLAEIGRLKDLGQVDRILTSGGGPWETRAKRLERYQQAAEPEITILGGGGLDRVGVKRLLSETRLREFHTGRTVWVPEESFGKVHPQKVRQLFAYLRP